MIEFVQNNPGFVRWMAAVSIFMFIGTLLVVPFLIVRIPEDYFTRTKRERPLLAEQHPLLRISLLLLKNVVGYGLILLGIALLVLPGQGILTIVVGMVLIDFPNKYRLERWLISRRGVLRTINWLRRRIHKKPVQLTPVSPSPPDTGARPPGH